MLVELQNNDGDLRRISEEIGLDFARLKQASSESLNLQCALDITLNQDFYEADLPIYLSTGHELDEEGESIGHFSLLDQSFSLIAEEPLSEDQRDLLESQFPKLVRLSNEPSTILKWLETHDVHISDVIEYANEATHNPKSQFYGSLSLHLGLRSVQSGKIPGRNGVEVASFLINVTEAPEDVRLVSKLFEIDPTQLDRVRSRFSSAASFKYHNLDASSHMDASHIQRNIEAPDTPAPQRIKPQQLADCMEEYLGHMHDKLRPKQIETIGDIIADLRQGNIGGIVKRPMGTGKTVIFSFILASLTRFAKQQQTETGTQHSLLMLAPTSFLGRMAYKTLTQMLDENTGLPFFDDPDDPEAFLVSEKEVRVYADQTTKAQKKAVLNSLVMIMTTAAYESKRKRDELDLRRVLYAAFDEADLAKDIAEGEGRRTELALELTKTTFSHGFSATTKYISPKYGVRDISETLYNRTDHIHSTSYRQAAEGKEVAPTKNLLLMTHMNSGVRDSNSHEFTKAEQKNLSELPGRDDALIEAIFSFTDPDTGIALKDLDQIWFFQRVKQAHSVADKINMVMGSIPQDIDIRAIEKATGGFRKNLDQYQFPFAMAVDGNLPHKNWTDSQGRRRLGLETILELHRTGFIPVLCNAKLLIRGFDSPRTQLSVVTFPLMSPGEIEQMGGRPGRQDEFNLNKIGYVVNVLDQGTERARIFADKDIAEIPFVGHQEGNIYEARPILDGKPERIPDFSVLHKDRNVRLATRREVEIISDPGEFKHVMQVRHAKLKAASTDWVTLGNISREVERLGFSPRLLKRMGYQIYQSRDRKNRKPVPNDTGIHDLWLAGLNVKLHDGALQDIAGGVGYSINTAALQKIVRALQDDNTVILSEKPEHWDTAKEFCNQYRPELKKAGVNIEQFKYTISNVLKEATEAYERNGVSALMPHTESGVSDRLLFIPYSLSKGITLAPTPLTLVRALEHECAKKSRRFSGPFRKKLVEQQRRFENRYDDLLTGIERIKAQGQRALKIDAYSIGLSDVPVFEPDNESPLMQEFRGVAKRLEDILLRYPEVRSIFSAKGEELKGVSITPELIKAVSLEAREQLTSISLPFANGSDVSGDISNLLGACNDLAERMHLEADYA